MPYQTTTTTFGSPASSSVGVFGNSGWRTLPVVAIARNVPASVCGRTVGGVISAMSIVSPRSAVITAEMPAKGTCSISMPAFFSINTVPMCGAPPMPDVP